MRPPTTLPRLCAACCARAGLVARTGATRTFATHSSARKGVAVAIAPTTPPRQQSTPPSSTFAAPSLSSVRFSRRASTTTRTSTTKAATETSTDPTPADPSPPSSPTQQTPPKPPPFYALFPSTLPHGAPPHAPFHIDVRALRREFLRLQAKSHPDLHHHASSSSTSASTSPSRAHAEAASALLNEAYRTLASPLLRAQYLLRTAHGVDLAGDEAGLSATAEPDVLGVVLEAREVIEEAASEADLEELKRENEERVEEAVAGLGRAFAAGDVKAATREAVRLRYWVNIRESVDAWEEGKGVVLQH